MNKVNKILEGKKTYIGAIVAFVGIMGLPYFITQGELAQLLENIFEIGGLLVVIYGRAVTKPK